MDRISCISVDDYSQEKIDAAVKAIFDELGGAETIIGTDKNIFIKVNLVREMLPEKCGTTHPSVVIAVAKILKQECNAVVTVGDSSGAAYTHAVMNNIYKTCGMQYACEQSGAELNQDFGSTSVDIKGKIVRHLDITDSFLKADAVINIGKLKTHSFAGFTGVVKNLYGLIPGLVKAQTHSLYPDLDSFTDCLVDIEQFASQKIVLHLLDAVIGMEGDGPTNGHPKFIGKLIGGKNPYFVDVAGVSLFAQPYSMPLLEKAHLRGLLPDDLGETGIDFENLKKSYIADFKTVKIVNVDFNKQGFLKRFLRREWVTPTPKVKTNICRGCTKCQTHCPNHAIEMLKSGKKPQKAHINTKKCIRCFCCQELCPFNAVKLKKPLLYTIIRAYNGSGKHKTKSSSKKKQP